MSRRPIRRAIPALAALAVLGILVTGCTPEPEPSPTPSRTAAPSASDTPTPTPTPEPTFDADGTAEDNLPIFSLITAKVWASDKRAHGRAYIDALARYGFDKSAMQVTRDKSTVGNPAESIQFAVLWGDECLVGQVGPATGDPVTVILPVTEDGTCLIGDTRPIDW